MSLIPNNAITNALAPINRQTNESLRAKKVQAQKSQHHAEDIQELEDSLDAITDQNQQKQNQQQPQNHHPKDSEDPKHPHLDISA